MRKAIISIAIVISVLSLASCRCMSTKDMEALVSARYQHQIDSLKLAEAEARLKLQEYMLSSLRPSTDLQTTDNATNSSHAVFGTEYDWLSERYCTNEDIADCSPWELCILRNSMYARHGRKFKREDLRDFFSKFSWYNPQYTEVSLTNIEAANVAFIKQHE